MGPCAFITIFRCVQNLISNILKSLIIYICFQSSHWCMWARWLFSLFLLVILIISNGIRKCNIRIGISSSKLPTNDQEYAHRSKNCLLWYIGPLLWRHNVRYGVSNHQTHDCLLNHSFRHRSKKISKLCVTGLCVDNSPVTDEFSAQRASNAKNVSIWWRHHVLHWCICVTGLLTMKHHCFWWWIGAG